jgi:hypothetical protein
MHNVSQLVCEKAVSGGELGIIIVAKHGGGAEFNAKE